MILIEKSEAEVMAKSHVNGYARKDGTFVKDHDDTRQARSGGGDYVAPKDGEAGHEEHAKYGAYHRRGDTVKDNYGKQHTVASHQGAEVVTEGGEHFHPTKLHHVMTADPEAAKCASEAADEPMTAKSANNIV